MRAAGLDRGRVLVIWSVTAVALALAVLAGYAALEGFRDRALAWPLRFAAGAVLASLADTLMPEAYEEGGPCVAWVHGPGLPALVPDLGGIGVLVSAAAPGSRLGNGWRGNLARRAALGELGDRVAEDLLGQRIREHDGRRGRDGDGGHDSGGNPDRG